TSQHYPRPTPGTPFRIRARAQGTDPGARPLTIRKDTPMTPRLTSRPTWRRVGGIATAGSLLVALAACQAADATSSSAEGTSSSADGTSSSTDGGDAATVSGTSSTDSAEARSNDLLSSLDLTTLDTHYD